MMIFIRAMLIVMFATSNVYLISHDKFVIAIFLGMGISVMWTYNVKDLAVSTLRERLYYVAGGAIGMTLSLYVLSSIFK